MGRWLIWLMALVVLSDSGFNVATWIWAVSVAIPTVGVMLTIITNSKETK